MQSNRNEIVIPVVKEEAHVEARPVETGSVRVTKRVVGEDEVVEKELRKERVEIERIKVDRPVDGPQEPYRSGDTLIVPVMAQVLNVEKRWVVTEEIHITKHQDTETARQTVTVGHEEAKVERLNKSGETVETIQPQPQG
ncbi:MAG TPA: YsnF/AvaK domain-containing protein [Bryobacteraceae bacterium]|nr:YsnF/AvaK domain-containing protein [Bryobacteraceae bacterium]